MFSFMRDFNDDPFFSGPMENMRRMESMMSPFGMFGGQRAIEGQHGHRPAPQQNMLMPFGFGGSLFPTMDNMFANFNQMGNNPNCHSFSSSSVMTYTTDETGRPQVYQASSSTRTAPGGVKETRSSVQDSRSGVQKMAIGHHLNEKGHVIEKQKNRYTGDEEENEELINLEDDEAEQFNQEWREKAHAYNPRSVHAIAGYDEAGQQQRTRSPQPEILAITDGSSDIRSMTNESHPQMSQNHPILLKSLDSNAAGRKKNGKHKRKHGMGGHKSSNSHSRPSPYQ